MPERVGIVDAVQHSELFQSLSPPMQTALFLSALVLLPSALVCLTGFTRIIIVLSFVRRAVTSQDIPPNMVLTGLALFMTAFVMAPTWDALHEKSVGPYLDGKMSGAESFQEGSA
jgi:flagellar biosynthesis protein FliP